MSIWPQQATEGEPEVIGVKDRSVPQILSPLESVDIEEIRIPHLEEPTLRFIVRKLQKCDIC